MPSHSEEHRRRKQLAKDLANQFTRLGIEAPNELVMQSYANMEGEVRKAYRKRALEVHPDKGGSAEEFRDVKAASEKIIAAITRLERAFP